MQSCELRARATLTIKARPLYTCGMKQHATPRPTSTRQHILIGVLIGIVVTIVAIYAPRMKLDIDTAQAQVIRAALIVSPGHNHTLGSNDRALYLQQQAAQVQAIQAMPLSAGTGTATSTQ